MNVKKQHNKELKVFNTNNVQKKAIYKLEDKHGKMITNRKEIVEVADLYNSKTNTQKTYIIKNA